MNFPRLGRRMALVLNGYRVISYSLSGQGTQASLARPSCGRLTPGTAGTLTDHDQPPAFLKPPFYFSCRLSPAKRAHGLAAPRPPTHSEAVDIYHKVVAPDITTRLLWRKKKSDTKEGTEGHFLLQDSLSESASVPDCVEFSP